MRCNPIRSVYIYKRDNSDKGIPRFFNYIMRLNFYVGRDLASPGGIINQRLDVSASDLTDDDVCIPVI